MDSTVRAILDQLEIVSNENLKIHLKIMKQLHEKLIASNFPLPMASILVSKIEIKIPFALYDENVEAIDVLIDMSARHIIETYKKAQDDFYKPFGIPEEMICNMAHLFSIKF